MSKIPSWLLPEDEAARLSSLRSYDLLPALRDTVWVGLSAGSLALTPRVTSYFAEWLPPGGADDGLALVDFLIFPHLHHPQLPYNTRGHAEKWATELTVPAYAIDDATALQVVDGAVQMISEGHWLSLPASHHVPAEQG